MGLKLCCPTSQELEKGKSTTVSYNHIIQASSSRPLHCIADFLKWETLHAFALGKTQMFLCILQKLWSFWKEYTGYCHLTCRGKMKKIIVRMWFLRYAAWKICLLCLAKVSFWNMTVCLIYVILPGLYAQD